MAIKTVTVVGEGKMGTNLFSYLSDFPFHMRWICRRDADLQKLQKTWQKKNARARDLGIMGDEEFLRKSGAIISGDIKDSADSDLVIETIPENLQLKKSLFKAFDDVMSPACILASNSSSILPSLLVASEKRKRTTIGLHFFYPVALKNLVELVVPPDTSAETLASVKEFLDTSRRFYLFQSESDAFLVNRIFLEFQVEAWRVVHEGLMSARQVDELIRERFFPIGAFECFDSVGIDIMLPSIENYIRHYVDKARYAGLTDELRRMTSEGKLGVKSGIGFFSYEGEYIHPGTEPADSSSEEIAKLVTGRLLEALKTAVRELSAPANLPSASLAFALREYFGVSDSSVFL
jgi:3-hydroxybutyryl-CoA dehydrogenase